MTVIPEKIDFDTLRTQISDQGVAIHGKGSTDTTYRDKLIAAIDAAEESGQGSFGIAVLDFTPTHTADLRDLAQELHQGTDLDTVIVRAPGSGATVSSVYSRDDIERAQDDFLSTANYATAVREYPAHLSTAPIPWTPLSLTALVVCLFTLAATYLKVKRENLTVKHRHARVSNSGSNHKKY
ncbi:MULTISPECIES: DUF6676 family protein [unclassified Corynebacterium]|uniref:Rv1476 family membrane protein n=1 Tax=unclassified Corynebacterium TaxID=2624378 RepID=UPI0029CA1AA3|nr:MULTISPECIES: DUF6676 family protein [unclassified Corynebacterium]WPF67214.1 hypothetical protein OLX12_05770 [Corynebacterium sp. 22KM0430]WPF69703.1 hypothetical protein OLW90_05765 [Corynebacterium sp. 21KM1197]